MAEKKKPQRRKSALSNMSPVAPPPEETAPTPTPAPAPVSTPAQAPASADGEEKKKWPKKESFYRSPELAGRLRSAFLNTMATEDGEASLSAFIARAVEERVERLEQKYNKGEQWPPVGANQIPKGPPRSWTS